MRRFVVEEEKEEEQGMEKGERNGEILNLERTRYFDMDTFEGWKVETLELAFSLFSPLSPV